MMEILYKVNRIRNNTYDEEYMEKLRNMNTIDRTEKFIEFLNYGGDKRLKDNSKHIMDLMHHMDSVKKEMDFLKGKDVTEEEYRTSTFAKDIKNSSENSFYKIINFLKSLNVE